jgi:hypothetical protein
LVATSASSTGFAAASCPATRQNVCVNEPYQILNCPRLPAGQYSAYAATSSTSTSPCACTRYSPTDYYSSYSSCIPLFRQGARGISGVRTPSGCYAAGGFGSSYYANCPYYNTYTCKTQTPPPTYQELISQHQGMMWRSDIGWFYPQGTSYSYCANCPSCSNYANYPSCSYYACSQLLHPQYCANYPYCSYNANYPCDSSYANYPYCYYSDP